MEDKKNLCTEYNRREWKYRKKHIKIYYLGAQKVQQVIFRKK
jgi:hypothetical protein